MHILQVYQSCCCQLLKTFVCLSSKKMCTKVYDNNYVTSCEGKNVKTPYLHYFHDFAKQIERSQEADLPDPTVENPYQDEQIKCILCKYNVVLDYKNVKLLYQFISPFTGRLYPIHITRLCSKQYNLLVQEVKKARSAGLMSFVIKDPVFLKDPWLFDPHNPIKPHPY